MGIHCVARYAPQAHHPAYEFNTTCLTHVYAILGIFTERVTPPAKYVLAKVQHSNFAVCWLHCQTVMKLLSGMRAFIQRLLNLLRVSMQVAPDFSCRLMDESYGKENETITRIQDVMVDYFKQRTGPLAKSGLGALKQSMAGIYYLPFQAATSLFFRFSGQSIPNRYAKCLCPCHAVHKTCLWSFDCQTRVQALLDHAVI